MRVRGLLSVLLLVSTYGAAQSASPAEVEQLQVKREGSEVKIEIMLTGAVQPSVETAINPDRLVLSLPGVISDAKQKRYPLNADGVRGVRMGLNNANPPVTRVVVDLDSALPYTMSANGRSIVLHVQAAESAASKHQGAVPAASAPLIGMFHRKPPTPPSSDVAAAAPIPVPPRLPPIIYTEKPASAQPVANAVPEKPSAAHPKTGSLQQGTVFPGMGTPGNGAVPRTQAPAVATVTTAPANNGPGITGVTGGSSTSAAVSSGAPAPAVSVSIVPTTAKKERPVANTVTPYSVAEVITPSTQSTVPAAPSVTSPTPTVVAGATTPFGASDQAPSPNSSTSSAAPSIPTTSSAGAPNITSKVVSATVVTPAPPTTASTSTPSQVATVAVPASPPPKASPAPETATVANSQASAPAIGSTPAQSATEASPLAASPASTTSGAQVATTSDPSAPVTPTFQGATVSNPLGLAPDDAPIAPVPVEDSNANVVAADESSASGGSIVAFDATTSQVDGVIPDTIAEPSPAGKKAGTTTIAKTFEPDAPTMLLLRAAHPDFRSAFRIKYVASGAAYLDGGRSAGLSEGMKLVVRETATNSTSSAADGNDDHIVAELEVTSVAETSAVTDVHTPKRDIAPGDLAYLSAQDEQALVQQSTMSATRKYPTVISFTEGDTLDEEARAEIPKPPMPSVNRARGRVGIDYMGTSFHGGTGGSGTSMNLGLMARMDMTRIAGTYWNLSGYWRGRLNKNSYSNTQTIQDMINRTYHLSMTYDNPGSRLVAGFGRMYLPWAVSLDTIDGGYIGARLGHGSTMGVFAGSTPDPTSWSYNPDRRIGGVFVNFEGGSFDSFRYSSTSGVALSTIKWKLDRPFVFFENGIYYKRYVSIYDTLQADSPAGNQAVTAPGAGIGRNFLTVRFQPHERIEFDANYNYFRDLPTFDPTLIGTTLLDKYLFQGFSAGVRLEVLKQIWVYTNLGRSNRSGDPTSSLNQLYGLTFGRLPWVRVRADAHYTKFNSSFGSGYYESLSLSRTLNDSFRLEVLAGKQNYTSALSTNSNSNFVTSNLEMNFGFHYFLQGGYTVSRGVTQNYDQWLFTLGYRFDSRQKAKNQ